LELSFELFLLFLKFKGLLLLLVGDKFILGVLLKLTISYLVVIVIVVIINERFLARGVIIVLGQMMLLGASI
jgi:hypothetical protein